ncbi:MAG: 16S rRNA (uracil(1498)-N(3))-methyltransferase [Thermodesulfobacteriota bacterium]
MNKDNAKIKHTFYLPPEKWNPPFTLAGQEAVHMIKVLRLQRGETIRIIDGQGTMGIFEIVSTARNKADLTEINREKHPVPEYRLCLGIAWSKALRRSWLLEKAAELGAWEMAVWMGENSQGRLKNESVAKWQGPLISGAKQSLNPWLPKLSAHPGGLQELLQKKDCPTRTALIQNRYTKGMLAPSDFTAGENLVIIGPEGGFSPWEQEIILEKNIPARSLGSRMLRWETAAMVALSLHHLNSQGR